MDLSDNQLVTRILAGEHPLFAVLVERYKVQIYNLMYRLSGNSEDAADLTQDVFCKVFEKLGSYRDERSYFSWLYTSALNHGRDWRRRQRQREKNSFFCSIEGGHRPETTPESMVEAVQRSVKLNEALGRLPEDRREMVILRYRHDRSIKELGEIFSISESAVKMRLSRAISDLGRILKERDDD